MSDSIALDGLLANLALPIEPEVLYQKLGEFLKGRDPYDFVADQNAQKARDCWIASKFLLAHAEKSRRRYQVTKLMTKAPDIEYREMVGSCESLSIEAGELLSPSYKRSEEYRKNKMEREACERSGRAYNPADKELSTEFLENERIQFPVVASGILRRKLGKDYGADCTLVLYVNMWLFEDAPIRKFAETYQLPARVRFKEIWFLYGETIIPLKEHIIRSSAAEGRN